MGNQVQTAEKSREIKSPLIQDGESNITSSVQLQFLHFFVFCTKRSKLFKPRKLEVCKLKEKKKKKN